MAPSSPPLSHLNRDAEKQTPGMMHNFGHKAPDADEKAADTEKYGKAETPSLFVPLPEESDEPDSLPGATDLNADPDGGEADRAMSRITTQSSIGPGPPPDGGLQAWLAIFATHLVIMNTWGIVNSYGVFQPYYTTTLSRPPSDIAWIGSFEVFLLFFIGAFAGRLTDAGYFRPLFISGFLLVVLGMVATSFCTQYWQFFLAQGICMGLGNGFLFCPSLSTASTYFDKKKALALGFVSIGSSTGGMIYPSMVRQLLPKIGFGWTIRAIALVQMVTLLVTSLVLKPRIKPRKAGSLVEWAAFKELEYTFYAVGSWLNYLGVFFASYYIAAYSRDIIGLSYTSSLNLLLLLNGTGVPGRVIPAYFASYYIGTINMFIPMSFISGIMMLCWPAVSSVTGLYIWTTFYGFFTGAIQSLMPSGIGTLTVDPRKQGTRMGMTFTIISFAVLIGQPIAGAIISAMGGSYVGAQVYAGACMLAGMCFLVAARMARARKSGKWLWIKV
ncbi:major facilitator superfamily transporter [Colletotrichum karsti]|uniref:Major facilitator superfamily transporter n=1 Tax=Colletotrichum karsti TaxID=1095194 RepID=A0A9P6HUC8_9PEZI|nr:major facilitator superfamily transporter [Colletotrichum karsti]KAF9870444.1 major facilitator superfamily transporter [Colletotrichum karsti]